MRFGACGIGWRRVLESRFLHPRCQTNSYSRLGSVRCIAVRIAHFSGRGASGTPTGRSCKPAKRPIPLDRRHGRQRPSDWQIRNSTRNARRLAAHPPGRAAVRDRGDGARLASPTAPLAQNDPTGRAAFARRRRARTGKATRCATSLAAAACGGAAVVDTFDADAGHIAACRSDVGGAPIGARASADAGGDPCGPRSSGQGVGNPQRRECARRAGGPPIGLPISAHLWRFR